MYIRSDTSSDFAKASLAKASDTPPFYSGVTRPTPTSPAPSSPSLPAAVQNTHVQTSPTSLGTPPPSLPAQRSASTEGEQIAESGDDAAAISTAAGQIVDNISVGQCREDRRSPDDAGAGSEQGDDDGFAPDIIPHFKRAPHELPPDPMSANAPSATKPTRELSTKSTPPTSRSAGTTNTLGARGEPIGTSSGRMPQMRPPTQSMSTPPSTMPQLTRPQTPPSQKPPHLPPLNTPTAQERVAALETDRLLVGALLIMLLSEPSNIDPQLLLCLGALV